MGIHLTEPSPEQRPTTARIALDALRQKRKRISQRLPSDLEIFWNTGWRNFLCIMASELLFRLGPPIIAELISGKEFLMQNIIAVIKISSFRFQFVGIALLYIVIAGLTGLVFVRLIRRFHQSQSSDFKAYHLNLAGSAALVFVIANMVFNLFIYSLYPFEARAMEPFYMYFFSGLFVRTALSVSTLPSSILFARWYEKQLKKSSYQIH